VTYQFAPGQLHISSVALKNTCRKFDIPVPSRGYWAKLQAGKPTTKVALPARAAGMDDEVVFGGRNYHWSYRFTNEEILGPLPAPSFPEDIALVRDRVRKIIGKVSVAKAMTAQHPAIARLIAEDEVRRQNQLKAFYTFSWDEPAFDSPFEQRRLRFLNALLLAVARCSGKPQVGGRDAREISVTVHQTSVALSLDRPLAGHRKGASPAAGGPDQLHFAILAGYDRDRKRTSWQDGEGGRLERFIREIAVEVVTSAEVSYREGCIRGFEWRVRRKAHLEEDARNRQLQVEREQRERQQKLAQARIDRLLDEAASLRRAMDIRAYVDAVKTTVASETTSILPDAIERWSKWALVEADRIDPVKTARFLENIEADNDAN
jgi:hypothetical protein